MTARADRPVRRLDELDYLSPSEAADFCRVSDSQFREHAASYGLAAFTFMGKKLYRKSDLISVLECAWHTSRGEGSRIS